MTIKKIISDNDGVNIDSEDVAMRVMDDWGVELIRRYQPQADLPPDYIYRTYPGTSTDRIVDALVKKFNLSSELIKRDYHLAADLNVAVDLADQITIETNNRFRTALKSIPGTTQAWTKLRDMLGAGNIAMATTSRADRMDVSLAHAADPVTGENARLDEMFPKGALRRSGYGHNNKYDEAFAALGWNPAETAIIEDSLSGVAKAKAGRPETAVIGTVAAKFYEDKDAQTKALLDAGAAVVIAGMADLPKAVAWLNDNLDPAKKPDFEAAVATKASYRPPATKPSPPHIA